MFSVIDKVVYGMAAVRFMSAAIEFTAAMLMLKFGRVETAFKINSVLAMIGPTVLLTVTGLGLIGLVGKVSLNGIAIIILGVALIFIGLSRI
ncbi:MAG: YqhV family protein [Eubacteriales bacterium]